MQSDTKHQQDDPDLRKFVCHPLICHKARCERAYGDPRHQIADDRRETHALGKRAQNECQRQADHDGRNEGVSWDIKIWVSWKKNIASIMLLGKALANRNARVRSATDGAGRGLSVRCDDRAEMSLPERPKFWARVAGT